MKNCPFEGNLDFIVMYHDGVMPGELEKRFEDHLVTCTTCMETLFRLRGDLFSMENSQFVLVPRSLDVPAEAHAGGGDASPRGALFRFIRGMLNLVENPAGGGGFELHEMPGFLEREGVTGRSYQWRGGGVAVYLRDEGANRFSVVCQGLAGRSVALIRNRRKVESHTGVQEDHLVMGGLASGSFEIHVDDEMILQFHVEEVHGS